VNPPDEPGSVSGSSGRLALPKNPTVYLPWEMPDNGR
jgi:hypothetical protein